jgi:hypothetical protein
MWVMKEKVLNCSWVLLAFHVLGILLGINHDSRILTQSRKLKLILLFNLNIFQSKQ